MEMKRVVVTGLGAVTPLGNNVPDTWQAMKEGRSGVGAITLFDATNFKTRFAGEVKDFDITQVLDRKEARKMDRYSQFAVMVAKEALEQSRLNLQAEDPERIGVVWATGMGGLQTLQDECADYALGDGTPRFSPFYIPKVIPNIGAAHISLLYGLKGPNFAVSAACSSSGSAIAAALDSIRVGRADIMLTGGSEAVITPLGVGGFNALRALSTRNDSPETASRPYSKSRDGFVMGEGAGCLVLEEYEHALRRGATIYAELAGAGINADAYHITAPEPEGKGAMRVMQLALQDAGMTPADIDYINTHGTSTPLGDVAELMAIKQVWGEDAYRLSISSTKSMTGHLIGATGAVEAIASIMAMREGIVPPTINHEADDEDENIDYRLNLTFNKAEHRELRAVMSNNFGFGGHNACLLFKKI
jgi:3-oxoacyl-[acyl-carrier-protein] synthase II